MNDFGLALRRWRRLRGIKQSHAAELLGVGQATISRWEQGHHAPSITESARLAHLLEAPLDSAGDRALYNLVGNSSQPVHLVCDLSHRLLAASRPRLREWRASYEEWRGVSLWRFATAEIRAAEERLSALGWYDTVAPSVRFWTSANHAPVVTIQPGLMQWDRLQLSDGTLARLVTSHRAWASA
jgi:transcriptional regulator with XRE-family HTH domain